MALARQVHTDLVRAPGLDRDFEQGAVGKLLADLHQADRAHAVRVVTAHHLDAALAVRQQVLVQRHINHFQSRRPAPQHQGQVGLTSLAFAELILQMFERAALLGDQQNARRLPVQAVHQFQKAGLWPCHAQLFNHAKADAAAAMDGDAGRFVDRKKGLVFQ